MYNILKIIPVIMLAGCVATTNDIGLEQYTPVTDYYTNSPAFHSDLTQCREIAHNVQLEYNKKQEEEFGRNLMVNVIGGAILGAAIGDNGESIMGGAMAGALSASNDEYTNDLVKYGPRRVIDRCMANRGHKILNDIGRGYM